MAQTGIRKGFFFYFGLLVLVVIAVVLVCMTVMIFLPGTPVLWMQYFTNNKTYTTVKQDSDNGEKIDLDWSKVNKIVVNAENYAHVVVKNDTTPNLPKVAIVNKAKGFALAKDKVDSTYSIVLKDGVLTISVDVPSGFLNISKDYDIVINGVSENTQVFDGKEFIITTGSGTVDFGGREETIFYKKLSAKSIDVTTTSGEILFSGRNFSDTALESLTIKTESGKVDMKVPGSAEVKINVDGNAEPETVKFFGVKNSVNLTTTKGGIKFETLKTGNLTITNGTGTISIGSVVADGIKMDDCESGIYEFNKIILNNNGEMNWAGSEDHLGYAIFNVKESLEGNVNISSSKNSDMKVTIAKLAGNLNIVGVNSENNGTSVDLTVNSVVKGQLNVEVNSANITYAKNSEAATDSITAKDDSVITFKGATTRKVTLRCSKEVLVNVVSSLNFTSTAYTSYKADEPETNQLKGDDKINVSIDNAPQNKNPLVIGENGAELIIVTGDTLTYRTIAEEQEAA